MTNKKPAKETQSDDNFTVEDLKYVEDQVRQRAEDPKNPYRARDQESLRKIEDEVARTVMGDCDATGKNYRPQTYEPPPPPPSKGRGR